MEPFLGEIRLFTFGNIPQGWVACNGQLLPLTSNQALYMLLGKTYGGDGVTNFGVPDLRGRAPIHYNGAFPPATLGGSETVELTIDQIPPHVHNYDVSSQIPTAPSNPNNQFIAAVPSGSQSFAAPVPNKLVAMSSRNLTSTGAGQGHPNIQPSLVLNFCIATSGIYPQRP